MKPNTLLISAVLVSLVVAVLNPALSLAGQLPTERMEVFKKTPIPFQPFEVKDPRTGKPIPPDTMLTLPDGRQIMASTYYAEINRIENHLNSLGYSLRSPITNVKLQRIKVDRSKLNRQASELQAVKAFVPPRPRILTAEQITKGTAWIIDIVPKPWVKEYGDRDILAAGIDAGFSLNASSQEALLNAHTKASVWLVNEEIKVLDATARLNSKPGQNSVKITVMVRGDTLFNDNRTGSGALILPPETKSSQVDKSANLPPIPVGPIPVTVKLGAYGRAGFTRAARVENLTTHIEFKPFVDLGAIATVSVDLVVGGFGARGRLVLLQDTLTATADVGIRAESPTQSYAYVKADISNTISSMNGNLEAYVYFYAPCFCSDLYKKYEYSTELVNWGGVNSTTPLLTIPETRYYFNPDGTVIGSPGVSKVTRASVSSNQPDQPIQVRKPFLLAVDGTMSPGHTCQMQVVAETGSGQTQTLTVTANRFPYTIMRPPITTAGKYKIKVTAQNAPHERCEGSAETSVNVTTPPPLTTDRSTVSDHTRKSPARTQTQTPRSGGITDRSSDK